MPKLTPEGIREVVAIQDRLLQVVRDLTRTVERGYVTPIAKRELALDFVFGDIHFTKDAGETDYQLDNCGYEFYEDGDIPAIPMLILGLIDAGAALKPFAEFDDGHAPESLPITAGSSMARKQLTIGDCRLARTTRNALLGLA